MSKQNYKNHPRYVPMFHVVTFGISLTILVLACIQLYNEVTLQSALFMLIAIVFLLLFYFVRAFPLKAQDRAIRAEENLRYYVLTGKLLSSKLSISQIIALRFADDKEFVQLAERAVNEGLSSSQIKSAIINWRADEYRV